jgi:hypothetical protein
MSSFQHAFTTLWRASGGTVFFFFFETEPAGVGLPSVRRQDGTVDAASSEKYICAFVRQTNY